MLDEVGGFLAGYAALAAVVLAAVKGTREWDDWKQRRVHEKQAEVAGAVISASRELETLRRLAALYLLEKGRGAQGAHPWTFPERQRAQHEALELLAPATETFRSALSLAEAYLPSAGLDEVRELWALYTRILKAWSDFVVYAYADDEDVQRVTASTRTIEEAREDVEPTVDRVVAILRNYTLGGGDEEQHEEVRA